MPNDDAIPAERLRELLLDLEQAERRERELRVQSEALLAGVRALTEATTPDELFDGILRTLREPLGFDDAFVLRPSRESNVSRVAATTNPTLLGLPWRVGRAFSRVLDSGRAAVHLDVGSIEEWQSQIEAFRIGVGSALCVPLRGSSEVAVLVCTRREARGFQPSHEEMAKRFQPLATQALREAERVALVDRANRDMRLVLDAVDQGLLTIDREGRVVGEISGMVKRWFGDVDKGALFTNVLARLSASVASEWEMAWLQVVDDVLPLEVALDVMPSRLETKERTLVFTLRPVGSEESWSRMLVVVSDVTAALERERTEEARRELAAVMVRMVRDRAGFVAFYGETRDTIAALAHGTVGDETAQLRRLHTLKGNASISGLTTLARIAHHIEERLREGDAGSAPYAALVARWDALEAELSPLLPSASTGIAITDEEHAWLVEELRESNAPPSLCAAVASWKRESIGTVLERLAEQGRALATRLDKGSISITTEYDELRLDGPTYRSFFAALVHAVRNAIDHGIEGAEARSMAGKAKGAIVLRAKVRGDELEVLVEDDGGGIPWSSVAERAIALGLPHATRAELSAALFADGLTTRDEAEEISGRGVGLSALRAATVAFGGDVTVESEPGKGTRVRCVVPIR